MLSLASTMNYPISGYGNPGMDRMVRWNVDSSGNTHGASRDAQARVNARTGQFDHWSSAKANAGEAVWDGIGAIPVVGGLANIGRGIVKGLVGLCTGKGYLAAEGLRNIGKGILYSVPGLGTLAAGVNCAKNSFDAITHTGFAIGDKSRFGGNDAKQMFALQMMQGNMGYGVGLASPHGQQGYGQGYAQLNYANAGYGQSSPGYW
jgi:hypothetical protein